MNMPLYELREHFAGALILPDDDAYDEARTLWNDMIDKRPAIIARCAGTADAVRAVNYARENGLPLAVRGCGHNIAGKALCDDGLVVDLSRMDAVTVDLDDRRVTVEAGASLAEVDAATQEHALAVPTGINSTTGIAGLTLGGGFGWLSRKYGLTVDSLESAEVVTAAGDVVTASPSQHPDLFWALRGGGGNFGAVTRFTFRLTPFGPDALAGLIVFSGSEAGRLLRQWRDFADTAPDEVNAWVVMRKAPPLPFLPESVHGTEVAVVAFFYAGEPDDGQPYVDTIRSFGSPVGEHVGVMPYAAWQQAFDPLLAPGARNYWKSHNFERMNDEVLDTAVEYLGKLPSPHTEILLVRLGGAMSRPAADATAYPHRNAEWLMNLHGRWEDAAEDDRCISWARSLFEAVAPHASGGVYVNFVSADEEDRVRAAYGSNYDRLAEVKRKYDPDNLFSTNFNIVPA